MANIQLLHPCPIIGVTAGRSHGDPDKSRYQSGERLNKYSDGDHGGWLWLPSNATNKKVRRPLGERPTLSVSQRDTNACPLLTLLPGNT
ncbi:Guanine nucleotide exchange factor DBS [Dissostichus eleginoides]|uniref:Guanine nucleotide exchange factor DBS n=1 Tax=Dissostichus eleginoides TaxID=100907 RepID=A0AAD9CC37_DISEL|nr:Guanine nucleotide exchange factor DBS [Dissostichus eleginoides]